MSELSIATVVGLHVSQCRAPQARDAKLSGPLAQTLQAGRKVQGKRPAISHVQIDSHVSHPRLKLAASAIVEGCAVCTCFHSQPDLPALVYTQLLLNFTHRSVNIDMAIWMYFVF